MVFSSGCAPRGGASSCPGGVAKDVSVSRPEGAKLYQRLPRSCRLTARKQFRAVYDEGWRVRSRSFTVFGTPAASGCSRLGITVTRRVGPSTVRNRIKRRLREIFRRHRLELHPPMDIVVNAHPSLDASDPAALETELMRSFEVLKRRLRG